MYDQEAALEPYLPTGFRIDGQYEIVGVIGQGGTGIVYKAIDKLLEREVALKVLHSHYRSNAKAIESFKREYATAGAFRHESIATIYGGGTLKTGQPYLVLELLEGASLADYLQKQGTLSFDEFVAVFIPILSALRYAHASGVIHLDLKPSNVMMLHGAGSEFQLVKLVDFGLAKLLPTADTEQTSTSTVRGTSYYMSPEQCTTGRADQRSDIYSLGCMMFECLTGKIPFSGQTLFEVMYKHVHDSLSSLSELKEIPTPVASMILKCMKKAPEQRFQNVDDLEQVFRRLTSAGYGKHTHGARRRTISVIGLCCFFVIAIAAGTILRISQQDRPKIFDFHAPAGNGSSNVQKASLQRSKDGKKIAMHMQDLVRAGKLEEARMFGIAWIERKAARKDDKAQVFIQLSAISQAEIAAQARPFDTLAKEAEQYATEAVRYSQPDSFENAEARKQLALVHRLTNIDQTLAELEQINNDVARMPESKERNACLVATLELIGTVLQSKSQFKKAYRFYEEAESLAMRSFNGTTLAFRISMNYCRSHLPGHEQECLEQMDEMLLEVRNLEDSPEKLLDLLTLATWYESHGKLKKSFDCCIEARNLSIKENQPKQKLKLEILMANLMINQGDEKKAKKWILSVIGASDRLSTCDQATILYEAATLFHRLHDYELAFQYGEKSVQGFQRESDRELEFNINTMEPALNVFVDSALKSGKSNEARKILEDQLLPRAQERSDKRGAGLITYQLATLASNDSRFDEAGLLYEKAKLLFATMPDSIGNASKIEFSRRWVGTSLCGEITLERELGHFSRSRQLLQELEKVTEQNHMWLRRVYLRDKLELATNKAERKQVLKQLLSFSELSPRTPERIDALLCAAEEDKLLGNVKLIDSYVAQALKEASLMRPSMNKQILARIHGLYGQLLVDLDDARARKELRHAIELFSSISDKSLEWGHAQSEHYALAHYAQSSAEAQSIYSQFIGMAQAAQIDRNLLELRNILNRARLYVQFGELYKAESLYKEAIRGCDRTACSVEFRLGILQSFAEVLVKMRRNQDAERLLKCALEEFDKLQEYSPERTILGSTILRTYGIALYKLGKEEEGRNQLNRSIAILESCPLKTSESNAQLSQSLRVLLSCTKQNSTEAGKITARLKSLKKEGWYRDEHTEITHGVKL